MLALIYLGFAIGVGDLLCRRFYRFVSTPHRWAAATVVGTLLSTWFTYLAGLAFADTAEPLLWADLLFFVTATAAILWLSRKSSIVQMLEPRAPGRAVYDWTTLGALFIAICVLLTGMLYVNKQGRIRVSGVEAADFARQSAIAQSFALGHNFPPECPYYAGQSYHHDFLFYFQAGNLEFLGLNLAWSVDVLSVLGLMSMLALVMVLGELLFNSRIVGRVGAMLFLFPCSLAFIFLSKSQGEHVSTLISFVNQRHLPSAIAVFVLVLMLLVDQYRQSQSQIRASANQTVKMDASAGDQRKSAFPAEFVTAANKASRTSSGFIFSGLLLGALPLWSTSVFIGAAAVLFFLLILFPCRLQTLLLGLVSAVLALPQIALLRLENIGSAAQSPSHSVTNLISYVGFTFGAQWLLIAFALIMAAWFQRRFFIALCSLLVLALWLRLGTATSASDNLLNIWLIVANLFAAYGLWRLWKLKRPPVVGPIVATTLVAAIVTGGAINLFRIRNSSYAEVNYEKDDLVTWLDKNTKAKDVFLTDRFLSHPILFAGRRIFLGSHDSLTEFDFDKRKPIYRQMFESENPRRVFELLKQNHIDYVVFDDRVRHDELIMNPNERIYSNYFHKIYEDVENQHGKLVIYKVPDSLPASVPNVDLSEPAVTCFQGGHGTRRGQFNNPHGLTLDTAGNVFVADTDNGRIEKFSPDGTFLTSIGGFEAPNGIAVDRAGNMYVAEIGSKHRIRKLGPDGTFIAEWAPGLYGPRKVVIGPDNSVYVVDSGRNRIVKFSPDGQVLASWGSEGINDGQFRGVSSVAVDSTNKVYVADPVNSRIQVFDSNGKFLSKWSVPEWREELGFEDLAIDPDRSRLYGSSAHLSAILVFDLQGNRLGTVRPTSPEKLEAPSALALAKDKLFVLDAGAARVSLIPLQDR